MKFDYLENILTAPVYDVAVESPLEEAKALSGRIQNTLLLKREDIQPVFSFKIRGAYARMAALTDEERARGVITASAGNHAQGVALAAKALGCKATICMPAIAPQIKVNSVKARGADVILQGENFDATNIYAQELAKERGATFVPPYDDPYVIAGQGTVGMEILRQRKNIDAIFVPIGGGGLAAGIAVYVKRLKPGIKVYGVEPYEADSMYQSILAGERVKLPHVGLFADGVAVKFVGEHTFNLCREHLDGIIRVTNDEMCAAIKDVFEDTRSILEPAGALAIAGAKRFVQDNGVTGQTLVAIASGANMNFDRLRHVAERSEIGEQREAVFAVTIPEQPGAFKTFLTQIGNRSITEFNYRYSDNKQAHIFVGVQVQNRREAADIVQQLSDQGHATIDLTDNELAKLHVRHLVGGHANATDERLFRFEFPERPGALMGFLTNMSQGWNITLFHYRNHGADYGRVLIGLQVPSADHVEFESFLERLGYDYVDETDNPAYQLFLR
ncbi:threonine ammonia-lyase, biosynthetic [Leeia sp. TBRC 13508]|uniref:L-threonine dehydratase n=1 Tax=Leeia speluncae TaxID=2884804 RepID=A0ABS8D7A4_9NEIS|nr:threonine ammonia-lyase, biosynthetic [Leeia speluncae]MCB6184032.1 threonine ammonia-lyase, biosynthetic [Leeia speluncae]